MLHLVEQFSSSGNLAVLLFETDGPCKTCQGDDQGDYKSSVTTQNSDHQRREA